MCCLKRKHPALEAKKQLQNNTKNTNFNESSNKKWKTPQRRKKHVLDIRFAKVSSIKIAYNITYFIYMCEDRKSLLLLLNFFVFVSGLYTAESRETWQMHVRFNWIRNLTNENYERQQEKNSIYINITFELSFAGKAIQQRCGVHHRKKYSLILMYTKQR